MKFSTPVILLPTGPVSPWLPSPPLQAMVMSPGKVPSPASSTGTRSPHHSSALIKSPWLSETTSYTTLHVLNGQTDLSPANPLHWLPTVSEPGLLPLVEENASLASEPPAFAHAVPYPGWLSLCLLMSQTSFPQSFFPFSNFTKLCFIPLFDEIYWIPDPLLSSVRRVRLDDWCSVGSALVFPPKATVNSLMASDLNSTRSFGDFCVEKTASLCPSEANQHQRPWLEKLTGLDFSPHSPLGSSNLEQDTTSHLYLVAPEALAYSGLDLGHCLAQCPAWIKLWNWLNWIQPWFFLDVRTKKKKGGGMLCLGLRVGLWTRTLCFDWSFSSSLKKCCWYKGSTEDWIVRA